MYQETKSERVKRNCCWDEFVSSVTEVACTTLHLSQQQFWKLYQEMKIFDRRGVEAAVTVAKQDNAGQCRVQLYYSTFLSINVWK